ncbi:hypothetical protein GCM10010330_04430 [Streptomyces tendae]|nr:hypothetical protein GCM10010330_04430 [Streptomyces tendae]
MEQATLADPGLRGRGVQPDRVHPAPDQQAFHGVKDSVAHVLIRFRKGLPAFPTVWTVE